MEILLAANPFGTVPPPPGVTSGPEGLISLLSVILRLLIVVGGIYALVNIIIAGYQFMSAGGDQKNIEAAWGRIWQSLVGLLIIAASFVIIAVISQIVFGRPDVILNPEIYKAK